MRAQLVRLVALALVALAVATPATARVATGTAPAGDEQIAYPEQWSYRTGPEELSLWFETTRELPAGTVINLQVAGCGGTRAVHSEYSFYSFPMTLERTVPAEFSIIGSWAVRPPNSQRSLGPRWDGVLTVTLPDSAPWVLEFDHDTFDFSADNPLPTNNDHCPAPGGSVPVEVQRWSTKTGQTVPAVGNRLTVSPTRAAGATVSYAWKVGRTVVDRDRVMTVKRAHRGKAVSLTVTARKAGATPVTRVLRYGRAR